MVFIKMRPGFFQVQKVSDPLQQMLAHPTEGHQDESQLYQLWRNPETLSNAEQTLVTQAPLHTCLETLENPLPSRGNTYHISKGLTFEH